ncbi:PucR family transcriptional regulator [Corynebacterium casei]|uniref:PucR family transcriptional regulator n=1 Tax=Corynebacterium casei TaxID=160386 RepID=UPI0009D4CE4C|nr:helix-turn-helix domain-containing protein [Corynebacterium casei]MDN6695456.1 helix-turn-helix domain-containing protein [Corynebacterium casei]SLM92668.1 regulator of polyketide synthase expression [Corynebacterium casei]
MNDIYYSTISSVLSRLKLEHEEIVVSAVNRIYKEMPEYAHVERSDLVNTVGEIIDLVLDQIGLGTVPDWTSSLPLESVVTRRIGQNIGVDSVMRGHRLTLASAQDRFKQCSGEMGLPFDDRLEVLEVFWAMSEKLMTAVARDYRQYSAGEIMHRRSEKNELIMLLLSSEPDTIAIVNRARNLSLDSTSQYRVIVGFDGGMEWMDLVERACSTGDSPAVAGEFDGLLAAVVPASPVRPSHPNLLFAVGDPRTLSGLPESMTEAIQVRDSLPKGSFGWHDVRSQSWRLAVPGMPSIERLVQTNFLQPLADEPDGGAMLLDSVWSFIEAGFSYRKASEALFVHENTLRYRISKFEELTSRSLIEVDTRMELAWLNHLELLGKDH